MQPGGQDSYLLPFSTKRHGTGSGSFLKCGFLLSKRRLRLAAAAARPGSGEASQTADKLLLLLPTVPNFLTGGEKV